jgi:hypothetical protein
VTLTVPLAPEADVLKCAAFFAIDEIAWGRDRQVIDIDARRGMYNGDKLMGVRERKRFQRDTLDNTERRGVGADAEGKRLANMKACNDSCRPCCFWRWGRTDKMLSCRKHSEHSSPFLL